MTQNEKKMISETIKILMQSRDMSLNELAEQADIPLETLRNIVYRKVTDPRISTLEAIADVFSVSINYILGKPFIAPNESKLITHYRKCGKHGKSVIELVANYEASSRRYRDANGTHEIPCVVPHSNIRRGIVYDMSETIYIWTNVDEAYTAIQVTNNDLASYGFCKKDNLLLENRYPENGEIFSFIFGDRVYIRKFIEESDHYVMKCLHSHGTDMVFKRLDEIVLVGTCCGVGRE